VRDDQLPLDFLRVSAAGSTQQTEKDSVLTTEFRGEKFIFAGSQKFVRRCGSMLEGVRANEARVESGKGAFRKMSFADWASLAWYNVVESHNVDHLAAGVRVERVRSWGGVRSYASKYVSKVDSEYLGDLELGRSWGIFNRQFMPWAKIIELDLDEETGVHLRRVARRYLEHILGRKKKAPYGITLYCDVERFKKLWQGRAPPNPF